MNSRRTALTGLIGSLLTVSALSAPAVHAQSALPKSITFVVPNAAGGSNDLMARAVAARLPKFVDSAVVVDNRPGAGGNLGSAWVAKSAPRDGSTWLVTVNSSLAINPYLYKRAGFDPLQDFDPVAGIAVVPHVLLVGNQTPINSMGDLLAQARQAPDRYSYGSAGNGTFSHLLMELMKTSQNVQLTHVPYKGVAPALTDLIGGQVQVLISTVPAAMSFIKSGKVRPIGVTSASRIAVLPDVPATPETVPGMIGELWVAIYAPKGTPRAAIEQLRAAVQKVQEMPEMQELLASQGATAFRAGPAELDAATREELRRWGPVVKSTGLTID